jgi:hypothetical protein
MQARQGGRFQGHAAHDACYMSTAAVTSPGYLCWLLAHLRDANTFMGNAKTKACVGVLPSPAPKRPIDYRLTYFPTMLE